MSTGIYPIYKIMELKYKCTTLPVGHQLLDHINLDQYKKTKPSLISAIVKNGDGDVYKLKFREIINKLNSQNMDSFKKEIVNLNMTNREHLEYLSQELIRCLLRNHQNPEVVVAFIISLSEITVAGATTKFKNLVVTECQKQFEIYIQTLSQVVKENIAGLFILINELYNNKIIPKKVIMSCLQTLLKNINKNNVAIDMVVIILKGAYANLQQEAADELNEVIKQIKEIEQSPNISLKQKFVILDYFEQK